MSSELKLALDNFLEEILSQEWSSYYYYKELDFHTTKSPSNRAMDSWHIVKRYLDVLYSKMPTEDVAKRLDIQVKVQAYKSPKVYSYKLFYPTFLNSLHHLYVSTCGSKEVLRNITTGNDSSTKTSLCSNNGCKSYKVAVSRHNYPDVFNPLDNKVAHLTIFDGETALIRQGEALVPIRGRLDIMGELTLGFSEEYGIGHPGLVPALLLGRLNSRVNPLPEELTVLGNEEAHSKFQHDLDLIRPYVKFDIILP